MSKATKTVILNTGFAAAGEIGETELHYGLPFTVVDTGESDAKGVPKTILVAELDAELADSFIEAGRVTLFKEPVDDAKRAKLLEEEAAAIVKKAQDEAAAILKKAQDEVTVILKKANDESLSIRKKATEEAVAIVKKATDDAAAAKPAEEKA